MSTEAADLAKKREDLLRLLDQMEKEPAWKDEDHPEIVKLGTAEYVRQMRHTLSPRQKRIDRKLAEIS